jgi:glycosyltransferase involved in cell wall biosynthesis
MRILFIITRGDTVGGASIHVRDLSRRLLNEGHEVHVLLGSGEVVPAILQTQEIPFTIIPSMVRAPHPLKDCIALLALLKFLWRWQPKLISTHTSKAGALGRLAALLFRIPAIYTPHCWAFADNFPRAKLYRGIERIFGRLPAQIVAVSQYEEQMGIAQGVCQPGNTQTIHNGMPDFAAAQSCPQRSPAKIVMLARFDSQKDHQTLLLALSKLKHLDWQLELIGDGPLLASIQSEALRLKLNERITFNGYSNKAESVLKEAQIFVLATLWESFPRSILEAMRAGLPVIASDVGGCSESVEHGETGFIVKTHDHQALCEKLELLIQSPELRKKMGQAGRERYEKEFTFEIMFRKYQALYSRLIQEPQQQWKNR